MRSTDFLISEEADEVFLVQGPASNWIIIRDRADFTIIDGGYPADTILVLESVARLGQRAARAAAMVITHGHTDHTGAAAHFAAKYGTPILSCATERPQLLGEEKFQVTIGAALPYLWRPVILRWAVHAIRAGGMQRNNIPTATAWDVETLSSLPGTPMPIPTPGHTPGHCAYFLPATKTVISGDALVTGHPISSRSGPQLLHPMYHHDPAMALRSLDALATCGGELILPGHGPAYHGVLPDAVSAARF